MNGWRKLVLLLGLPAMVAGLFGCAAPRREVLKPVVLNNFVTELVRVENLAEDGTYYFDINVTYYHIQWRQCSGIDSVTQGINIRFKVS